MPGTSPDYPVNAGRKVRVKTSVKESLELAANGGARLTTYDVTVEIPLKQPDLGPGEMRDFTVSTFTRWRAF